MVLKLVCFHWVSDSMEHILNELEDLFQSLVRRMNKSEMEDFELVIMFLLRNEQNNFIYLCHYSHSSLQLIFSINLSYVRPGTRFDLTCS